MPDNIKLQNLRKFKVRINCITNTFEELSNFVRTSEDVQDRDECIAAANRMFVNLCEIQELLEQDIMLTELIT